MESKNNKTTYKFGHKDIDLQDYVYNLGTNLQSYMLNKGWSDSQRQLFVDAYNTYLLGFELLLDTNNNRFTTDDAGTIKDSLGLLSGDMEPELYYDDKGGWITSEEYLNLKDKHKNKYKPFLANREVANYFNLIGLAVPNTKKEENKDDSNKFNLSKHGFISYWLNLNNPMGGKMNLKPYLDMDKFDPTTGKRSRINRSKYLAQEINNYLQQLKEYDFEGSNFIDAATYKQRLANAASHLADGTWDNNDIIALNLAGIGGDFQTAFFSEEENPDLTEDQRKLIEKLKKEEEEQKKKEKLREDFGLYIDELLRNYDANQYQWTFSNPYNMGMIDKKFLKDDGTFDDQAYAESFKLDKNQDLEKFYKNYFNLFLANPFTKESRRALAGLIGMGYAQKLLDGKYYIAQPERDERTNSGLIYDPLNSLLYYSFIGDIAPLWNKRINWYKEQNGLINRRDKYNIFKEGGTINKLQLGGGFDPDAWMAERRQERLQQQGETNSWNTSWHDGRTAELQEAGNRKVFSDPTMENPDNGFSGTDLLRLGSIGADVTSMVTSFLPGVGSLASIGLGVGSTIATAAADIAEDGLDWGDAKNFVTNIGMDLLGMIPGGGAASKTAKIGKTLKKYVPRILATLSTIHTAANINPIMVSFNKILDPKEDLTVDDWRNIAAGLGVITGGVGATQIYKKQKQKLNTLKDSIAVGFVDKKTGKKQTRIFTGEDAKNIKEAKETNNLDDLKKVTTDKYEELHNFDVDVSQSLRPRMPIEGWKFWKIRKPWHYKDGKMAIYDVNKDSKGIYVDKGDWLPDEYKPLKIKRTLKEKVDAKVAQQQKEAIDPLVERSKKIGAKVEEYNKKLPELEKQLKTDKGDSFVASSELSKKRKAILDEADLITSEDLRNKLTTKNKIDSDLTEATNILNTKKKQFNELDTKVKEAKTNASADDLQQLQDLQSEITILEQKVKDLLDIKTKFETDNAEWSNWLERISKSDSEMAGIKDLENLILSAKKIEVRSKLLQRIRKWLEDAKNGKVHSKNYNEFKKKYVTGTGDDEVVTFKSPSKYREDVTMSFKDLLELYGIIYKKGGTLNISKVRSFDLGGKNSISNTTSKANWYRDMYNSNEMLNWIKGFNLENYKDFNDFQTTWRLNLIDTLYNIGTPQVTKNENVYNRLKRWNSTGTNAVIERLVADNIITHPGVSGDNSSGGYTDGYFGEQEYLRHGGSKESWADNEEGLKSLLGFFDLLGLEYYLDPETLMYLLRPKVSNTYASANKSNVTDTRIIGSDNETTEDNDTINNFYNLKDNNITLLYRLPRALIADKSNRRMTNLAKEAEIPFYQIPFRKHAYVMSDLDKEMLGINSQGYLNSLSSRPVTSDGETALAALLAAAVKGLDIRNNSLNASDARLRQTAEKSEQYDLESDKNAHDVAQQNRLSGLQTASNKAKYELAYLSKKHNIWDTLAQQEEKEANSKYQENKLYEDYFIKQDIENAIKNDLKTYDSSVTPEEENLWNLVNLGLVNVSDLFKDPIKKNIFLSVSKKAEEAKLKQYKIYKGIGDNPWSFNRTTVNSPWQATYTPYKSKNGSKLEIASIKAKTAEAKEFQKNIRESIKRNEKVLDRLSKSIYKYINVSIVK